ncbi:MAG TPA: zf-TFIIB domain-containing protein [Pirellulaceae bacterium]|nr:zf-TFIIB domain-containing protein [Pirellulaceae bacterium]HMO92763.1 zf-TFIIB domain-containing protein [Pirellulaceae bacterium]HMP69345.1 zf-TFIIB domain-containing protein [Pirellulaceae bacterium]
MNDNRCQHERGISVWEQLTISDRDSGVNCPACLIHLLIATLHEVKVAACKECYGVMFQMEAVGHLINSLRASYQGDDRKTQAEGECQLDTRRHCPSCGEFFETHFYAGPGNCVIDSCASCRLVWLDRGELTSIVMAPGKRN